MARQEVKRLQVVETALTARLKELLDLRGDLDPRDARLCRIGDDLAQPPYAAGAQASAPQVIETCRRGLEE